eukprot:gene12872-7295_t
MRGPYVDFRARNKYAQPVTILKKNTNNTYIVGFEGEFCLDIQSDYVDSNLINEFKELQKLKRLKKIPKEEQLQKKLKKQQELLKQLESLNNEITLLK